MKTSLASALVLATCLVAGAAQAAPVTSAQKAEFLKVCVGISSDEALCTCKADAAGKLIDESFMDLVIASMKGSRNPSSEQYVAYNNYVARSNQICKPGY